MTLAEQVVATLRKKHLMTALAESCTGGLLAAAITDVPGASEVFDRGFVTYSNAAKTGLLGVPPQLLSDVGAVSAEVAVAMATGALKNSRADLAVAITGVAGPDGGTDAKPVGLVHFACARIGQQPTHMEKRFGALSRQEIRNRSVVVALQMLLDAAA